MTKIRNIGILLSFSFFDLEYLNLILVKPFYCILL
jgi:hypothetical protein